MKFIRSNQKNKRLYYQGLIAIELLALISLYILNIHWGILVIITPITLIDLWSNFRCANRQKKFIQEIEIGTDKITCLLATKELIHIPIEKCLFSIREKKFEIEKTEIEIRQKRLVKSKLIGRLHIKNWEMIPEIKNELIKNQVTQIKYRPEGYWSKYGTLTADVVLTGTALAVGEVAGLTGNNHLARKANRIFMPIEEIKDSVKNEDNN